MAPVAQWVECWTSRPEVVGSNPAWSLYFLFLQIIQHIFVQKMSLEAREDCEKQIECDELPFWS